MENQISEAISHIRKISTKKITIDRILTQINNTATTNWDLEFVKLYLNKMNKSCRNHKTSFETKHEHRKNSLNSKIY